MSCDLDGIADAGLPNVVCEIKDDKLVIGAKVPPNEVTAGEASETGLAFAPSPPVSSLPQVLAYRSQ